MVDIYTREAKGSPLSWPEQDQSIKNLKAAIEGLQGGVFVASWSQDPVTYAFKIIFSDDTEVGPIELPTKPIVARGAWVTTRLYQAGDIVRQGKGAYLVAVEHQSGTFAADLAAGKLTLLFTDGADGAAGVQHGASDGKLRGSRNGEWDRIGYGDVHGMWVDGVGGAADMTLAQILHQIDAGYTNLVAAQKARIDILEQRLAAAGIA